MRSSLHKTVKAATGQDVHLCQGCQECNLPHDEEQDIPLGSLIQLVLMDDEEVLTCRTLWSDKVLEAAGKACKRNLQLRAILLSLREEARQRGLI
jgi:hypothetical protein